MGAKFAPPNNLKVFQDVGEVHSALGYYQVRNLHSPIVKPFTSNFLQAVTQGLLYLMIYKCGAFYVGKVARQLRQRINDHVYSSCNGKMLTLVSRHLDLYHKFDSSSTSFFVLAVVPKNPRGGEWDKANLQ